MSSKAIQKRLQYIQTRLGLKPDGLLGPDTLSRIEQLLDQSADSSAATVTKPACQLICSRSGLEQIATFEISSSAYYRQFLSKPSWPKGESGITIGIGYDLGYQSTACIRRDWQGSIAERDIERLVAVAGLKKNRAEQALSTVADIVIPLAAANQVYYTSTLPAFAKKTRKAYPGVELLPADAQAMLLSLVYNRGASMAGNKRREMKAIVPLVEAAELSAIAEQIRAMKRLWGTNLSGLRLRRDREADLIEHANRDYSPDELVYL
ncbi:MAG: hypothetical protein R8K50_11200 [Mariprofundus sp.]